MVNKDEIFSWGVQCTVCAVIWQIVVVFIVTVGKMQDHQWLEGPI